MDGSGIIRLDEKEHSPDNLHSRRNRVFYIKDYLAEIQIMAIRIKKLGAENWEEPITVHDFEQQIIDETCEQIITLCDCNKCEREIIKWRKK